MPIGSIMRTILLLILLLTYTSTSAQIDNIKFRQMSPSGGFSLKGISTITQDHLGYIWMGTQQGLMRYDSNNTTWFTPSINDTLSLPNGFINDFYADNAHHFLVTTNKGLCSFNRQNQNFKRINYTYEDDSAAEDSVISIIKINNNKLLLIDALHFGILDLSTLKMLRIATDVINHPVSLHRDNSNRIWIGTRNGNIFRFNAENHSLNKVVSSHATNNCIYAFNNFIWVGTNGQGAKLYDTKGTFIKQVSFTPKSYKNSGNVRVIKRDTYGRIWFGTYEGLFMDDGRQLTHFDPDQYEGIPHNSIYEIFEDRQGGIWIGTWSGGVALVHHADNNFQTFRHTTGKNSLSNNTVSSFIQTDDDNLLIGTEVGGLNQYNLKNNRFSTLSLSKDNRIDNIKSICKDKLNGVWVGTFKKGLWHRPMGNSTFKQPGLNTENGRLLSSLSVYSLCAVDTGLWIGTFEKGLFFYNYNKKSLSHPFTNTAYQKDLTDNAIQTLLVDSNSNLWIGTLFNFIYKIHLPSNKITKGADVLGLSAFNEGAVYCFFERSNGDIWMGTKNNGILIYHPLTNKYESFFADDILYKKDVYGIIEDDNQRLWISSNNGLVLYNPESNTTRHFSHSDDIQSNLFCPQAIFKNEQGHLFFGGTNGFTRIDPSNLKLNLKKPNTFINHLSVSDGDNIYPVYKKDNTLNTIILKPGDNTFSVVFSVDNYFMPEKTKYKYRLINHNDQWIETKADALARFNKVKDGNYIFEVKACNNDGFWNDEPTRLPILIKSHWYKTNMALIAYSIIIILTIALIIRFYTERLKLKRAIINEKNQRENEEQMHEMKLKFFTNVSHEFRTPLTLISWPLKKLVNAQNITPEQKEELQVIKSNSNRLLQLINQLLDIRKLDLGKEQLNISKFDIVDFAHQIQQSFSFEAKSRNIAFKINNSTDNLFIEADKEKVNTLFHNLLSNAFKFVADNGQITININQAQSHSETSFENQISFGELYGAEVVEITIEDNGIGIEGENLMKIFNRFDQGESMRKNTTEVPKGSGLGLSIVKDFTLLHQGKLSVQSQVNIGSRFTIVLPTRQKAQKILFESHKTVKNLNEKQIPLTEVNKPSVLTKENTVLVVEDNKDFNRLICNFLQQHYQIISANNGVEAIKLLQHHNIDLVVSDIMMPQMDGIEFCNRVKTQIETSHIPVILLTALSSNKNLIAGLDKGADAYITKPFDEDVLLKQIENILKQRQRIRENFSKQFTSESTLEVGSLDSFFLNRVKSVIEKQVSKEDFGIDTLTKELMISRSQLHRKIKSLSGMTTSDFVNMVKVKKAVELIKNENLTFSEVAFRLGFSSQSYFTRCFKKVYNTTPKAYFDKNNAED